VQAPLGFRCSSLTLFNCGNFDSPFGLPQDDQVGAWLLIYAWYRFADVKNGIAVFGTFGSKREAVSFPKQLNICDLWSQLH
jgi:hypothetical protein